MVKFVRCLKCGYPISEKWDVCPFCSAIKPSKLAFLKVPISITLAWVSILAFLCVYYFATEDDRVWNKIADSYMISDYVDFISDYPRSSHRTEAVGAIKLYLINRIDVISDTNDEALRDVLPYLEDYPDIENRLVSKLKDVGSVVRCQEYLKARKHSLYAAEVESYLDNKKDQYLREILASSDYNRLVQAEDMLTKPSYQRKLRKKREELLSRELDDNHKYTLLYLNDYISRLESLGKDSFDAEEIRFRRAKEYCRRAPNDELEKKALENVLKIYKCEMPKEEFCIIDTTDRLAVSPLKVISQDNRNYVIKLVNVDDKQEMICFFVPGKEAPEFDIPDGTYEIKYASGNKWYGERLLFGDTASYSKADKKFTFRNGEGYSITLYKVPNGNLKTLDISAEEF